ncbi:uncharacterized protein LOC115891240 [Sitophilus oryzae]|uniref:Uncharacterized protein LOC115891240 n=1 Tax=Sitophilus oryzae TaxID=7048 RepID=A0A6J2YXF0_SITOR|nr:uncharacterized protein LOC115891240 [Sitophilus oryzae]
MDKNIEELEKLKQSLESKARMKCEARFEGKTQKKISLHIRGMDSQTSKEEIQIALEGYLGPLENKDVKIGELRPNYANTQAITVNLIEEDANILEKSSYIKIGMVRCEVERRIGLKSCRRCWAYDHEVMDCKGPDRKGICFKCGKEGHNAKECSGQTYCLICEKEGHSANGSKCDAFKKALKEEKRKKKDK